MTPDEVTDEMIDDINSCLREDCAIELNNRKPAITKDDITIIYNVVSQHLDEGDEDE